MAERLTTLLTRKLRTVKAKNSADLRAKLLRYAAGQGYDFSTAKEAVESLVKSENEQCDDWDF
jgi:SOS response regulatory protein OraA/RecX